MQEPDGVPALVATCLVGAGHRVQKPQGPEVPVEGTIGPLPAAASCGAAGELEITFKTLPAGAALELKHGCVTFWLGLHHSGCSRPVTSARVRSPRALT